MGLEDWCVFLHEKKLLIRFQDFNLKIERAEGRRANFEVGPEDRCLFARKKIASKISDFNLKIEMAEGRSANFEVGLTQRLV